MHRNFQNCPKFHIWENDVQISDQVAKSIFEPHDLLDQKSSLPTEPL